MKDTWIHLPRSIRNCPFWPKTRRYTRLEALIDLMCDAEYELQRVERGGHMIDIPAGGLLTIQVSLARRWRWDRKTVSKFLSLLESLNFLRIETQRGIDKGYTLLIFQNSKTFFSNGEIGFSPDDFENSPSGHPSDPHNMKNVRIKVSREDQYVGDAPEHLSEGVPEGVRSNEAAAPTVFDDYLELGNVLEKTLEQRLSLKDIHALSELTVDERRKVKAEVDTGQSLTAAIAAAKSRSNSHSDARCEEGT